MFGPNLAVGSVIALSEASRSLAQNQKPTTHSNTLFREPSPGYVPDRQSKRSAATKQRMRFLGQSRLHLPKLTTMKKVLVQAKTHLMKAMLSAKNKTESAQNLSASPERQRETPRSTTLVNQNRVTLASLLAQGSPVAREARADSNAFNFSNSRLTASSQSASSQLSLEAQVPLASESFERIQALKEWVPQLRQKQQDMLADINKLRAAVNTMAPTLTPFNHSISDPGHLTHLLHQTEQAYEEQSMLLKRFNHIESDVLNLERLSLPSQAPLVEFPKLTGMLAEIDKIDRQQANPLNDMRAMKFALDEIAKEQDEVKLERTQTEFPNFNRMLDEIDSIKALGLNPFKKFVVMA